MAFGRLLVPIAFLLLCIITKGCDSFLFEGGGSSDFNSNNNRRCSHLGWYKQQQHQQQQNNKNYVNGFSTSFFPTHLQMVRNIDLPEAIIFYGKNSIIDDQQEQDNDCNELLPGIKTLLEECNTEGTATILIHNNENDNNNDAATSIPSDITNLFTLQHHEGSAEYEKAPNPKSLYEAIDAVTIQPRGFGGSSGFGRKQAEDVRNPLPKHCVVFCNGSNDIDICKAARYIGMRCISFFYSSDDDNELADAIIDDGSYYENIWLDEIATPGSYWLNPPYPRDDNGDQVPEIHEIIQWYEDKGKPKQKEKESSSPKQEEESSTAVATGSIEDEAEEPLSDDEIQRILADMDGL